MISLLQLQSSTIIITMFVIFLTFPSSNGTNDDNETCPLISCGTISNIGYPVWGADWRPKYCGHPMFFELQCPSDDKYGYPSILHIHQYDDPSNPSSHWVLGVDNSTITINLQDCLPEYDECFIPSSNLTAVAENVIEYSARVESSTLLDDCNCPNVTGSLTKVENFTCGPVEGNSWIALYWKNNENKDGLNKFCNQSIQVPVIGKCDGVSLKLIGQKVFGIYEVSRKAVVI